MSDTATSLKDVGILKSLWERQQDRWGVAALKGIMLTPKSGSEAGYFAFENDMVLMTQTPGAGFRNSFGPTNFILRQSIVPVVAWNEGDAIMRCIGTASVISCTGYLVTAAHVIIDPYEQDYGLKKSASGLVARSGFNFGVLIPNNPAFGGGEKFYPFEEYRLWGKWIKSPLLIEKDQFELSTDVAICKIPEMGDGSVHQPLNMSLNSFAVNEVAFAFGYSEMEDIPLIYQKGQASLGREPPTLYVSVGNVVENFPRNALDHNATVPGPCFDFRAKIPGKMSGGPIFGADGAVVRGVISRSFSNELHAFGAMLAPALQLPLGGPAQSTSVRSLMVAGNDGIPMVQGMGL